MSIKGLNAITWGNQRREGADQPGSDYEIEKRGGGVCLTTRTSTSAQGAAGHDGPIAEIKNRDKRTTAQRQPANRHGNQLHTCNHASGCNRNQCCRELGVGPRKNGGEGERTTSVLSRAGEKKKKGARWGRPAEHPGDGPTVPNRASASAPTLTLQKG